MILLLANAWGLKRADGIMVSLRDSQDEFAALLAVARRALNRELKVLEADGAIAIAYSKITVLDRALLEAQVQSPAGTPGFG